MSPLLTVNDNDNEIQVKEDTSVVVVSKSTNEVVIKGSIQKNNNKHTNKTHPHKVVSTMCGIDLVYLPTYQIETVYTEQQYESLGL